MTLMTRVSRLFRADLHAVLDRIEEPDLVLRQAIREMEEDLTRDLRHIQALHAQVQQIGARDAEIERSLDGVDDELDLCFQAGKDDLSRALIRRRLEGRSYRSRLSAEREALASRMAGLEQRAQEHEAQLDAMRQKAELLAPMEPDTCGPDARETPDLRVRNEDVEVAFLRERQRRQGS